MGQHIAHALIGNTAKRKGWIGQTDGTLPTYEGSIPVAEIQRHLFNFEAISVPSGNFIPCGVEDADWILPDGRPCKIVITPGAQGIVRSDDGSELGRHKAGWRNHGYDEWLLQNVSTATQNTLTIPSALTLKNGAQAAVEFALDETVHDSTTGLNFWPFLLAQTSMDGSIATTYSAGNRVIECDNMFQGFHRAAAKAGRQYKRKHTINSMSGDHFVAMRNSLSILDRAAHEMTAHMRLLSGIHVGRPQWLRVLDIIEPPAQADSSKVKVTKTTNRRELLDSIYKGEGELGALNGAFAGTAFGVIQANNTYQHHGVGVRGASRIERVYDRMIRNEVSESDGMVLDALAEVLQMPELVSA